MTGGRWPAARPWSWRRSALRIVRFEARALLIVLAYGLVLAAAPLTVPGARAAEPRVVIIVGPAGGATDGYRADGDAAAAAARAAGADVTTVYSPDATWPRVRAALQGASIVVYMGHGNGFPSPYGPVLNKSTKDGLGLNPIEGGDDEAHQYFGEAYLTNDVRLAPHAVVLLHHLCYASGNSEPGRPEGDLETARQRVDNMAAGWLAAGAEAVLAEAYDGPAGYVARILAGKGTIESIWRSVPTANGNVLAYPSERTPGYVALLDPTEPTSGFYRSLVTRTALKAEEVRRGAALIDRIPPGDAVIPVGPIVESLALEGVPTAGSRASLAMGFERAADAAPPLGLGIRWDALALDPASLVPRSADPSPSSLPSGEPAPGQAPSPDPDPAASRPPEPTRPETALVAAEVPGAVVNVSEAHPTADGLAASIAVPERPGLYRLVVTLHDPQGVAFASATQERIPALVVRVTGALSATIAAPQRLTLVARAPTTIPVTVLNSGTVPWYAPLPDGDSQAILERLSDGTWGARLVGHWVALGIEADRTLPDLSHDASVHVNASPAVAVTVDLDLVAPAAPGQYLLVLDIVSPLYGSLTALGSPGMVIRVEVAAPAVVPSSLD